MKKISPDEHVKCLDCGNVHKYSERVETANTKTCPNCKAGEYFYRNWRYDKKVKS